MIVEITKSGFYQTSGKNQMDVVRMWEISRFTGGQEQTVAWYDYMLCYGQQAVEN